MRPWAGPGGCSASPRCRGRYKYCASTHQRANQSTQVCGGLKLYLSREALEGKLVIAVCNLKPAKLAGAPLGWEQEHGGWRQVLGLLATCEPMAMPPLAAPPHPKRSLSPHPPHTQVIRTPTPLPPPPPGVLSEAMLLAADTEVEGKRIVRMLEPAAGAQPGDQVGEDPLTPPPCLSACHPQGRAWACHMRGCEWQAALVCGWVVARTQWACGYVPTYIAAPGRRAAAWLLRSLGGVGLNGAARTDVAAVSRVGPGRSSTQPMAPNPGMSSLLGKHVVSRGGHVQHTAEAALQGIATPVPSKAPPPARHALPRLLATRAGALGRQRPGSGHAKAGQGGGVEDGRCRAACG